LASCVPGYSSLPNFARESVSAHSSIDSVSLTRWLNGAESSGAVFTKFATSKRGAILLLSLRANRNAIVLYILYAVIYIEPLMGRCIARLIAFYIFHKR
jgi:hypothetical protein